MKRIIVFLSILVTLSSCKQAAEKVVEAVTESILEPVSVTFSRPLDMGEMAVNPEATIITMEVKNKSSDDIRKLKLTLGLKQNLLKFAEDLEGIVETPGYKGTCGEILQPGKTCTFVLSFVARKIGTYSIALKFDYENLIEPQSRLFELKAIIGEPAALAFTNEISNYDFGVIEQTDPTKRLLEIEVKNTGGLSARNMNFILENDNSPAAYAIEENKCPTNILGGEKCKIIISYRPYNNDYSDPAATYTGKFSFEYQKDPQGNFGKLNVYFTFLSTTIEAKFKQNFTTVEFTRLVAGNKETKTTKITNAGYRAGIMKKLQIYNYQNNLITECIKGTGVILNCQKNLVDFPFIIEDSNSCLDREVQGVIGKAPGEGCFFKFTYWPSNTYQTGSQATHYFNESTISLIYDSQWKGSENIVTKNEIFKILADFFAAGKLVLDKVEIENEPLLNTDIIPMGNVYEANLGRLALVSSDAYETFMKVTLRNTGENIVTIKTLTDGALTPNNITDLGYDLNAFYKSIKHSSCTVIAPGAACNINFNLTPKAQATGLMEDNLMYDDYSNPLKKFKRILTSYSDGSSFEDDGSVTPDRSLEVRMISKLVRKGFLTIEIPAPTSTATVYNFPNIVHGQSSVKNIFIKNVGTGDVYAVMKDLAKNIDPNGKGGGFPFKMVDLGTPILPATKDCYDIIFPAGTTSGSMPATPDVSKFLAPNESCSLSIENKISETMRAQESDYLPVPTWEFTRPFSGLINNTSELWGRRANNSPTYPVAFKYYDGDANPDVPSSIPYGYVGTTKDMNVASSFASPAFIVVRDPEPITSALFHRPQLNYPSITSTYPVNQTLAAKTFPETYFDSSYFTLFTHGFARSKEAITHVQGMNLVGGAYDLEYKFHAGTFPINLTTAVSFKFVNVGGRSATSATLVEETKAEDTDGDPLTAHAIQVDSIGGATIKPYPTFTVNGMPTSLLLKLNFHPKAAGLYKRCYTLQYGNGIGPTEQLVCVYIEAVANSPKIEIAYKDVVVTQSGATVSETEPGGFTTLNTPMNSTDILSKTTFSAVKNSIVYAKKRFKFTNIGAATATKFNYYYMDGVVNAGAALPTDTTISTVGLAKPCTANKTLVAGDYCEIYIKYLPVTASAASRLNYIGTVTDMAPGLNQFVSYTGHITFSAFDPAKLVVNMPGVSTEVVTDWSNPLVPIPLNQSWPVNIGAYSTAVTPPHLLLTNSPTVKSITNYEIKNTSILKASFLAMNPTPGAGAWNTIFTNADITILANRYCFYGDNEFDAIPDEDKGFNNTSVNKCYLQFNFAGFKPYESCSSWNAPVKTMVTTFGQNIVANCNPYVYTLTYWNYKRAAQSTIPLHMKGFIEPNRVVATAPPVTSDVTAVSTGSTTGSVTFSWPELEPAYVGWGAITKYRVYYDVSYTNLNSITAFKLNSTIPFKETADSFTRTITVPNLVAGKYYYFKVFAVQTYTGVVPNLTYLSNSNIPILTAPIPLPSQIYNHSMLSLIDKSFKPAPGIRTTGITTCTADYYNLNVGGVVKKAYKTLINTNVFNYLNTNAAFNTGYPGEGIGAVPHWLSDNAYDMNTSISLYDGSVLPGFPNYSPLSLSGNNPENEVLYQKSCSNNASCDQLFKIVGGDGVDLYYQGTFYATASGASAYYRCYGVILCPTNTVKLITDPTCAKP